MLPKRLERSVIYESEWIHLYADKVQLADGKIIEKYYYLHYPQESVCAVIENTSGDILLIKSNRYVTGREEWEVPAGRIEDGENPEQAAEREVLEETGYEIKDIKYLCSFHPSNGMSDQKVRVYYAKAGERIRDFDINEVKKTDWFSIEDILGMLQGNEIQCGVSMLALLYAKQFT